MNEINQIARELVESYLYKSNKKLNYTKVLKNNFCSLKNALLTVCPIIFNIQQIIFF